MQGTYGRSTVKNDGSVVVVRGKVRTTRWCLLVRGPTYVISARHLRARRRIPAPSSIRPLRPLEVRSRLHSNTLQSRIYSANARRVIANALERENMDVRISDRHGIDDGSNLLKPAWVQMYNPRVSSAPDATRLRLRLRLPPSAFSSMLDLLCR